MNKEMNPGTSAWAFVPLKSYESPAQPLMESTDWKPGVHAFDDLMCNPGVKPLRSGSPQAIVGLFGHAEELLRKWAVMRAAKILEPPAIAALLDGTAGVWPELGNPGDTLFVIPALERCFLRHYRGIRLARQMVETLSTRPCRLIIGCDAWAWKYLCSSVQIDALCPEALTAAPLMALPAASDDANKIAQEAKDLGLRAYVLHTLLVHDGVSTSVLPQLLPFRATEVMKTLADLRERKLAFQEGDEWRVAREHYSAIRKQLAALDFWVSET